MQVAGYQHVTERAFYRLAAAESARASKVSGSQDFRRGDLDRWIASCIGKSGPTTDYESAE